MLLNKPRHIAWLMIALTALGLSNHAAAEANASSPAYTSSPYARVLVNVIHDGMVDYVRLQEHHLDDLKAYRDQIAEVGPTATPQHFPTAASRLAYWINAYNATMLRRWLDAGAGQVEHIQTQPRVNDKTWFGEYTYRVDGRDMTLGQIEFEGVFVVSKDPRIHAALVCGAQSCPPLHNVPYSAEAQTLDAQLEVAARGWMHQTDGLYLDDAGRVWMSDVFRYFADDFDAMGGMAGVIQAWVHDADPRKPAALAAAKRGEVLYQKWNWTVNQAGLKVDRGVDLTTAHYQDAPGDKRR